MKLKYCSIMLSIILSTIGRASAEEPSTQYQWTDPKTGKIVTCDYPPANLQMRQIERRGNIVILEVLGKNKFVITDSGKASGSGKVFIGMKKEDVIKAFGEPDKINSSFIAGHMREQLIYKYGNLKSQYLYIEDGILTGWQDSN